MRVYNFSAGPSMLPLEVLEQVKKDFTDYNGTGMSVCEMSHRSKPYEEIHNTSISLLRELMGISDDYYVLYLQGGATLQFEAVPLNLLKKGKADYIVTGNFANNAFKVAKKYGDIVCAASSEDKTYTYIPKNVKVREDIDYLHITSNNTIFGTQYNELPKSKAPIVCDMSSNILGKRYNVNDFGLIYAGAQKNISASGLTVVIVRKNLVDSGATEACPNFLKYSTQANANSLYNTPTTFSIYVSMLVFKWLKNLGGVDAMEKINIEKSKMLYDFIDNSKLYKNNVAKEDRSIMNVPFVTGDENLDAKFVKEAAAAGLVSLKGHRLVGGMRASIYNAMPVEGIKALIEFMKKFEKENKQ